MNFKGLYKTLTLSAIVSAALYGCQDEVLVKTTDNTTANALLDSIKTANSQYITLDKQNGDLTVSNQALIDAINKYEEQIANSGNTDLDVATEIQYTINIVSAGNAEIAEPGCCDFLGRSSNVARSKGVADATVTVEQNGNIMAASSEGSGLYLFKGLRQGYVSVKISAENHADVEYTAYLEPVDWNDDETLPLDVSNAATQIIIYPISGPLATTVKGNAYAESNEINDTLATRYGSDAAIWGTNVGNYVSNPGPYATWSPSLQFEKAKAGTRIWGYPSVDNYEIPTQNAGITSITYKSVITQTTVNEDGTYELPVVAANESFGLINWVRIEAEEYMGEYTWYTSSDGEHPYQGGSTPEGDDNLIIDSLDVKIFNNTDADIMVYTGADDDQVTVTPKHAKTVKRRTQTATDAWFYASFPHDGSTNDPYVYAMPGETVKRDIIFWWD